MKHAALLLALLVAACSSEAPPTGSSDSSSKAYGPLAASLIVSDPSSPPSSATSGAGGGSVAATFAYVSLPPGTLADSARVRIENMRTAEAVTPSVVAGGFDPIAIRADAGDTLDVAVTEGTRTTTHTRVVAVRARPPRVVRTSPSKGQTDVPLNAVIVIVLSEPVDPSTVNGNGVRLRLGGEVVVGALGLEPSGTELHFIPAATLEPVTIYQLEITQTLTDRSGASLDAPISVSFTTAPLGPPATVTVSPPITEVLSTGGNPARLTATMRDASGAPLPPATAGWSSSDPTVVQVDASGNAVGRAPGTATITAAVNGLRGTATISALEPVTSINFGGLAIATIQLGTTACFTATPTGASGPAAGYQLDLQLPPVLALMSGDGTTYCVRAIALGSGTVTVHANPPHAAWTSGVTASVQVTVGAAPSTDAVTRFTITPDSATVQQGASVQLFPLAYIADGRQTNLYEMTWRSSNPAIATVERGAWNSAKVTGVAPGGPVVITASTNGITAEIPIRVIPVPPPPSGLVFASVSAGTEHTCGVTTSGAAYCWGDNTNGQLGDGTTTSSVIPVRVAGGLTFAAISSGDSFTCALTTSHAAYCWGFGGDWGLGNGAPPALAICGTASGAPRGCTPTPVPVAGGLTFSQLSAGSWHVCGITTTGSAYCWGWPYNGALGIDGSSCPVIDNFCGWTPAPVAGGLRFSSISAGDYSHSCGVTVSGAAYCWGFNYFGELGLGTATGWGFSYFPLSNGPPPTTTGPEACDDLDNGLWVACSRTPIPVAGGLQFGAVSPGGNETCGVTTIGAVYCWGYNGDGQLADGSRTNQSRPTPVSGGLTFAAISNAISAEYACGVTIDGRAYCWGSNGNGQLGNGTETSTAAPTPVAGGLSFAAVSAGGHSWYWYTGGHACGLTTGGVVYCWGDNGRGELGDGTNAARMAPVRVVGQ